MMKNIENLSKQVTQVTGDLYQAPVLDTTFCRCFSERCYLDDSPMNLSGNRNQCDSGVSHRKRKKRGKLCTERQWIHHCKALQRLSASKPPGALFSPPRGKKVPLRKLCPRINCLSQPRNPIKKREYVKDPHEFQLPGKIRDWNAHCQWLVKNAEPKEYPDCFQVPLYFKKILKIHVSVSRNNF